MELEGCRTHSTSAFKPSSASRTTRDEVVRLPIYGRNSKEAVRAPSPQHLGPIEPNKPSEKEAHPRTNLKPAAFRPMLAFRSVFHFDWCSVSTGVPFRLSPLPTWRLIRLAPSFRSAVTFRLALMLTWRSCSTRCSRETAAAHTVHGPQELIPHGRNRAACMISRPPTQNRAFAGKILTLCIPNRLIASRNACME